MTGPAFFFINNHFKTRIADREMIELSGLTVTENNQLVYQIRYVFFKV